MRHGFILAFIALSACNQQNEPTGVEGKDEAEVAPTVQPMVPGFYAIKSEDTVYSRTRLSEDGNYTDYDAGDNAVGGGSWTSEGATICFDPAGDGENEQESCWINEEPGEDGSFVTRLVDGDVSYVVTPLGE